MSSDRIKREKSRIRTLHWLHDLYKVPLEMHKISSLAQTQLQKSTIPSRDPSKSKPFSEASGYEVSIHILRCEGHNERIIHAEWRQAMSTAFFPLTTAELCETYLSNRLLCNLLGKPIQTLIQTIAGGRTATLAVPSMGSHGKQAISIYYLPDRHGIG